MSLYLYSLYILYSSGVYPFGPEDTAATLGALGALGAFGGFCALAVVVLTFETLAGVFLADLAFLLAGAATFLF
jgi:hypothetical protein